MNKPVQIPFGVHLLKESFHLRQLILRGSVCRTLGSIFLHDGTGLIDILNLLRPQSPHKMA